MKLVSVRCVLWAWLACLAIPLPGADETQDAYTVWANGRPEAAIPALYEHAQSTQRWDAWLDCGLAAAAAGQRGAAVTWLVEAQRRAPHQAEPVLALRALDAAVPSRWLERAGPLAWPGTGWCAVTLAAIGGLSLGLGLTMRRRRGVALTAGVLALLTMAPGQIACWLDQRAPLIAIATDTHLLDSTGSPLQPLSAGTIAVRISDDDWAGRMLVRLNDGTRGYVARTDTQAHP